MIFVKFCIWVTTRSNGLANKCKKKWKRWKRRTNDWRRGWRCSNREAQKWPDIWTMKWTKLNLSNDCNKNLPSPNTISSPYWKATKKLAKNFVKLSSCLRDTGISCAHPKEKHSQTHLIYFPCRVDALKQKIYKLSHMYANHDDCLFIEKDIGTVLLETPFSAQFIDLIDKYLKEYDSFPTFLASVSLRLFEKKQLTV